MSRALMGLVPRSGRLQRRAKRLRFLDLCCLPDVIEKQNVTAALGTFEPVGGPATLNTHEPMEACVNNSSIFTADKSTHLKIVVISLIASIAVIIVGIAARTTSVDSTARIQTAGPAVKAGKPTAITHSDASTVR